MAERFDWQYSDDELSEWLELVMDIATAAEEVTVVFSNNHGNFALRSANGFGEMNKERQAGRDTDA